MSLFETSLALLLILIVVVQTFEWEQSVFTSLVSMERVAVSV